MKRRRIYRRILVLLLLVNLAGIAAYFIYHLENSVPDEIKLLVGEDEEFDFSLIFKGMPVEGTLEKDKADVAEAGAVNLDNKIEDSDNLHLDFGRPFTLRSSSLGESKLTLKLFGIFPVKEVNLKAVESIEVIPCGMPIGIYVETDGLLVLGTGGVKMADGTTAEPAKGIIKTGDYILSVNGRKMVQASDMVKVLQGCSGNDLIVEIRRNQSVSKVKVKPVADPAGDYKAGIWIRSSTQGIGTLTYMDMRGQYAALGHGITDIDTELLMEVRKGYIYQASILTITKGVPGTPGELIGIINKSENSKLGSITCNTVNGIAGEVMQNSWNSIEGDSMPIGLKQEVKVGEAYIRSYVSGEAKYYKIMIEKIEKGNTEHGKGMVIRIVDDRLLGLTGGIVQGMSGSPIIQDDKLIGAVTHVFVKDATMGYGTFIENMLFKE